MMEAQAAAEVSRRTFTGELYLQVKHQPGLGVVFPNDSLIWLDDPTSKLGLEADTRTRDRASPW